MEMLKKMYVQEQGQGVAEYALILTGICMLVLVFVYAVGENLAIFYNDFIARI